MVYLEWSIKIRIVSFSEYKLTEEMFYWFKFWGILESIENAKKYDSFFVKFETTTRAMPPG